MQVKYVICLFFVILCTPSVYSQCHPVFIEQSKQSGASDQIGMAVTNLYSTYSRKDSAGKILVTYHIFENGAWKNLPVIKFGNSIPNLIRWKNKIIACSGMNYYNGNTSPTGFYFGFLQYENGKWDSLPGGLLNTGPGNFGALSTENDLWYYRNNPSAQTISIYKYDTLNSKFVYVTDAGGSYTMGVQAGKNRLLVSNINTIKGRSTTGFAYIENDSIHINTDNFYSFIGPSSTFVYGINYKDDRILAFKFQNNPSIKIVGSAAFSTNMTLPPGTAGFAGRCEFVDDKLVWSIFNNQNTMFTLCNGETKWNDFNYNNADWTYAFAYDNKIYNLNKINHRTYELGNGAYMHGKLYVDFDTNCQFDQGLDYSVPRQNVSVRKGKNGYATYFSTDDSGQYRGFIEKDTLLLSGPGPLASCMQDTVYFTGDTLDNPVALERPSGFNVRVELLNGNRLRWNAKVRIRARVNNLGRPMDSVHFSFKWKKGIKILSCDVPVSEITDSTVSGVLYNLNYFDSRLVNIDIWVDTANTKSGDTALCIFHAESFVTEVGYEDNTDSINFRIMYSFDPNYKSCKQEAIPVKTVKRLDYFIEFQNEGNDDAYDVTIVDTLENRLSGETLVINETSHAFTASMKGRILTVTFKDIHLKPKSVNDALSKGFLSFSVHTVNNLSNGDSVRNRAFIYFDLNKPVVTGYAVTHVSDKLVSAIAKVSRYETPLLVYPNPGYGKITVSSREGEPIYIYNVQGELIFQGVSTDVPLSIDTNGWAGGLYLIRSGTTCVKFIKAE